MIAADRVKLKEPELGFAEACVLLYCFLSRGGHVVDVHLRVVELDVDKEEEGRMSSTTVLQVTQSEIFASRLFL